MNKILRRVSAVVLASAMTLLLMTACAEEVTLLSFLLENDRLIDMEGYNFTVADKISDEGETILGYRYNTTLSDAVLSRINEIEMDLNCTLEFRDYGSAYIEDLLVQIISDSFNCEALYGNHEDIQELAQGGLSVPITDYLNLVDIRNYDKYGTAMVQECNAYQGEIYALSPLSWLYKQPNALELLVFNMNHVDKYGRIDPHEYLENGTWNWDALEEIISTYYVSDGNTEIYSLATRNLDFVKLLCLGNGVKFTYKDADGNIKSDFGSSEMLEAMDFYKELYVKYPEHFVFSPKSGANWNEVKESFMIDQNSMVCLTSAGELYNYISYEVTNYSVLPFPTGPNGEYGIWPSINEGMEGFAVISSASEPENAIRIIDMICEPLDGYETEDDRRAYLESEVFYDSEDAEIAMNTHKNGTYSYWKGDIGNFQPDTLWREYAGKLYNKTAMAIIEEYESVFNEVIDTYMTPNLKMYDYFE